MPAHPLATVLAAMAPTVGLAHPLPATTSPALARVETITPTPSKTARPHSVLTSGYLQVAGTDRAALVEALAPRVPHLAFEPFEAAADAGTEGIAAFVDVRRESSGPADETVAFVLTIVVSDGRAFDRRIESNPDEEETTRLLASTVANLLLAIEAGTVEADRSDVPIPTLAAAPCPACVCPAPVDCPAVVPSPAADPGGAGPVPALPPRLELGPVVIPATILGLGQPAQADRFAAAGVTLGVHARLRRGAMFGAELRPSGRGEPHGHQLVRMRVAVGAGYRLRRGAWSLGASLWATVEPWWFRDEALSPRPRPHWGLAARLQPAMVLPQRGNGALALTVGPVLELSASASLRDDGAEVGLVVIPDPQGEASRLRVGGLELSTGLSATLWFGLPRRSPPPP